MMSLCISRFAGGNITKFGKFFNKPETTIDYLLTGKTIPRIDTVLTICYEIGITPLYFLTNGTISDESEIESQPLKSKYKDLKFILRLDNDELRKGLLFALSEDPPPSLSETASRPGYPPVYTMRQRFPDLCKEISRRYRLSPRYQTHHKDSGRKRHDNATIVRILELELKKKQPSPLTEIARALGYRSAMSLADRFPDLCRKIISKRRRFQRAQQERIAKTLKAILAQEPPLAINEVVELFEEETIKSLRHKHPKECSQISARYADFCRKARVENLRKAIEKIFEENPSISNTQLAKRIGCSLGTLYRIRKRN